MARLIDANGSYTLNECNETGHSLCFGGGFIDVYDPKGKHICQFWAGDAPTVDAVELPCKIGDTVYQVDANKIYPITIKNLIYDAGYIAFDENAIGQSVFLTRKEAEAKLGGDGNG